MTRINLNMG